MRANLSGTIFNPIPGLPVVDYIAEAKNLSEITFERSPRALVELREALKKAGRRLQEREVTFAIKHTETALALRGEDFASKIEGIFNYIFFELTTQWGMVSRTSLAHTGSSHCLLHAAIYVRITF